MTTTVIVFSRDRALQLDAALRSFYSHCADAREANVWVIYYASNIWYAQQYSQLKKEMAGLGSLFYVPQQRFQLDVRRVLTRCEVSLAARLALQVLGALRLLPVTLATHWLGRQAPGYVLFLVDDCLFTRDFTLADVTQTLAARPAALGYSLRLGTNTTECYPWQRAQARPVFECLGPHALSYRWVAADADFGYPLEVSSSVYRRADLLPLLFKLRFRNPNQLEGQMAAKARQFQATSPELLCFDQSVAFCIPVNKVQHENNNRAGQSGRYSAEGLARQFEAGWRIRIEKYNGFVANACHQEVDLEFVRWPSVLTQAASR